MKHIAIIGECMIELNGKPFGLMNQTFGGDTLNTAIYLRRGCEANGEPDKIKVSYVSALGNDPLSAGLLTCWNKEGISTDFVLRDATRGPGVYIIQLDDHGERSFQYWREQSAARYLLQHPSFSSVAQELAHVDALFLSGISLAILPQQDRTSLLNLLVELKARGVEVIFDSNYRTSLWPRDDHQTVKEVYQVMYQLTDVALVTFNDEQSIWGDKSPQHTLQRLASFGISQCIVKLGEEGCLIQDFTNQETSPTSQAIPTQPVSQVVDTTSAGDAFNGGFLSAYLDGMDLTTSCQRGNVLAGAVIQHSGAIIPKAITQLALGVR